MNAINKLNKFNAPGRKDDSQRINWNLAGPCYHHNKVKLEVKSGQKEIQEMCYN